MTHTSPKAPDFSHQHPLPSQKPRCSLAQMQLNIWDNVLAGGHGSTHLFLLVEALPVTVWNAKNSKVYHAGYPKTLQNAFHLYATRALQTNKHTPK